MFLLFDIGGTKMRVAASHEGTKIDVTKILPTPPSFKEGMFLFKHMAKELTQGKEIVAIAGGIAGPLNKQKSYVHSAPNLKGWIRKPLKRTLQYLTKGPVFIENDTALAGLGEVHYGAGKGKRIVVYYTISTGVGGARIVDGHIDVAHIGFEPGHQIIMPFTHSYKSKGVPLYLEDYISGRGLTMRYQADPTLLHNKKIYDKVAQLLGLALNNSIVHWSPEVVVLGGGLILHKVISITKVRHYLKQVLRIFPSIPPIKKAELGDEGGLYGSLVYIRQQMKFDN